MLRRIEDAAATIGQKMISSASNDDKELKARKKGGEGIKENLRLYKFCDDGDISEKKERKKQRKRKKIHA